jgi:hypothetical protein
MRRVMRFYLFVFALLLLPAYAAIDLNDVFSVDGSVRYHYETFRGFNEKEYGTDPSVGRADKDLILTRTRIGLQYAPSWDFAAKITLQDSEAWNYGFTNRDWYSKEFKMQNNSQINYLDLAETYIEWKDLTNAPILRIGRQSITYDNALLLGDGAWKNNQRLWDAVKYSLRSGLHYLDFFSGHTLLFEPDEPSWTHRYQYEGSGMYGHYGFSDSAAVESYAVSKINTLANDTYNYIKYYYYGLRIYDTNFNDFSYDATYIRQSGKYETVGTKTAAPLTKGINAYMYRWEAGYRFSDVLYRPRILLAKTYASGENASTNALEKFDGAYSSTTKYLGRMGLFSLSAINAQEISLLFTPWLNTNVRIDNHQFYLSTRTDTWYSYNGKGIGNNSGKNYLNLGQEIDLSVDYKFSETLSTLLGYCVFYPGAVLKDNYYSTAKHIEYPSNRATYGFLEMTYKF